MGGVLTYHGNWNKEEDSMGIKETDVEKPSEPEAPAPPKAVVTPTPEAKADVLDA